MKKVYININEVPFEALLACSEEEQQRGLMYIKPPVPNMVFVFGIPSIKKFWMKATPAPLDIIFCADKKIIDICYGEPFSTRLVGPNKSSDTVIEMAAGTVEKFGFAAGDNVGIFYL